MKKFYMLALLVVLFFVSGIGIEAFAHFGMIIPSDSMVVQEDEKRVDLRLSFSHPFESIGMELEKPKIFGMMTNGSKKDITGDLKKSSIMGHTAWSADYKIKRPGVYTFYMEPTPYWEPAEDCFIVHYTKTVVTAFGDDEGWDEEVGLPVEIVPLSKPFGLYTNNVFSGIVKSDGKSVSYATVEVEYYNQDKKAKAPAEYMITQTIKADKNGVFHYAAPKAGWWGFAALCEADWQIALDNGEKKDVELGAVIWVKFHDWQEE